jgi:uncharacterized protein involved in exopolysaccharide biosynthesis
MMNVSRRMFWPALHKLPDFKRSWGERAGRGERLVRSLEVTRVGEAYQFSIGARAGIQKMAAAIANAVTAAYIEERFARREAPEMRSGCRCCAKKRIASRMRWWRTATNRMS